MRALSGGMKRRVLVAQALVHKPPVIVLDEPTAGVDVELRQGLWRFIRQLNARRPHHRADHALPRGGRGAVQPHRDAQAGQARGARHHAQPAAQAIPAHVCAAHRPGRSARRRSCAARRPSDATDGAYLLALKDYAEVETLMAELRDAGVKS